MKRSNSVRGASKKPLNVLSDVWTKSHNIETRFSTVSRVCFLIYDSSECSLNALRLWKYTLNCTNT